MAFFKQVAGGKKDSSTDTEVSRSDVRNFKKNNKGDKFAKDLSYKDMKKMMSAFDTTINEDSTDNKEISYNTNNSGVRIIKVDGKDYKIDENNQVIDANGIKYEYKDGQLQKIQNGNTTTSFKEGRRQQDVKTEAGVTTTTIYNDKGNYKASETVTSHGGKLEKVISYMPNSENVSQTVTTDKRTEGQTVTTTDSGRTRNVKTKKTNQPDYEKQENFDLAQDGTPTRTTSTEKSDGVTTKTDYKKKTRTIADTKNNTDTEITFSSFDKESGDITVAKTVVTDKTNHSRITTNAGSKTKIIETLDNNNKTVKRTATIDTEKHTATIEVNGKKITLNTDSQGNILANAKFTGSRMETVGEAAIRLGYAKDSEEYNAIVKANGGADARIAPGKGIKISQSINNINKINLETAEVDSKAQVKAYKAHQAKVAAERQAKAKLATINNRIKNSNTRAAELAKNILGAANGGVRQTYATAKHKVYCDNLYNLSKQGYQKNKAQGDWQQHYVYNPITDKMVTLESVMDNNKQLKGAKVMYITENGYATLTDGRTIHISFDNFDNQMSTYVETLKTNYEASVEDLKKDAALSRANMEKMKTVDGQDIERTDAEGTQQTQTNQSINSEISAAAKQKGYKATSSPKIFQDDRGFYYTYDVQNKNFKYFSSSDYLTITNDGKLEFSGGNTFDVDTYLTAKNLINSNDTETQHKQIQTNINKDNVIDIYETYQKSHSNSIIKSMTSPWLSEGKGKMRDYVTQSTKHIIQKLIDKAKEQGVNSNSLQQAQEFIKDSSWQNNYINGKGWDSALTDKTEPIINNLIADIKATKK